MQEFFNSVLGILEQLWDIISNAYKTFGMVFTFISDTIPVILLLLGYMPVIVGTAAITVLIVMAVKFIIAR